MLPMSHSYSYIFHYINTKIYIVGILLNSFKFKFKIKNTDKICAGDNVKQLELSYITSGNTNTVTWKNSWQFHKNEM